MGTERRSTRCWVLLVVMVLLHRYAFHGPSTSALGSARRTSQRGWGRRFQRAQRGLKVGSGRIRLHPKATGRGSGRPTRRIVVVARHCGSGTGTARTGQLWGRGWIIVVVLARCPRRRLSQSSRWGIASRERQDNGCGPTLGHWRARHNGRRASFVAVATSPRWSRRSKALARRKGRIVAQVGGTACIETSEIKVKVCRRSRLGRGCMQRGGLGSQSTTIVSSSVLSLHCIGMVSNQSRGRSHGPLHRWTSHCTAF
jgi:hypothetical protein